MIKSNIVLFVLLISTCCTALAQDARSNTTNNNAWLMYFGNHKFSNRLGWHAEIQVRRHDVFTEDQQLLLRTGVDYYLQNNSRFTIGYAFIETHPYGEFAVPNAFPEHRIWQQFLTTQSLGKVKLSHRYRLEQRMIGNASTGEFSNGRFENRFRYMAKATINLTKSERPVFLAVYDEIFVNFGKEVGYNIFDQNRLYGALGLTLSPTLKIEAGYLYQVVQARSLELTPSVRNRIENNHTFQLGVFHTMSLVKD